LPTALAVNRGESRNPVLRDVVAEPGAQRVAKGQFLRIEVEVHPGSVKEYIETAVKRFKTLLSGRAVRRVETGQRWGPLQPGPAKA